MLDLVEQGSTFEDVVLLACKLEAAGVTIINTGIGWHEACVPTIATPVPRGVFWWRKRLPYVSIPVATCNRINTPEEAQNAFSAHFPADKNMVVLSGWPWISLIRPLKTKLNLLIPVSVVTKLVLITYSKVKEWRFS